MSPAEPDQTISSCAWRDEDVRDYGLIGPGWLMLILVTLRDRKISQRRADVEIPKGTPVRGDGGGPGPPVSS